MAVIERDIFLHAGRSFEMLQKSIRTFNDYLKRRLPPRAPEYYKARQYLKEGQNYLEETLKKAKLLLGPVSASSAQEMEKQRTRLLIENKIIVVGLSVGELRDELSKDDLMRTMMSSEEVGTYLKDHFVSQSSGKRKLANIKVRMILDKLKALSARSLELQEAAQKYFESGGQTPQG